MVPLSPAKRLGLRVARLVRGALLKAGPRVRIRLPPAGSQLRTAPCPARMSDRREPIGARRSANPCCRSQTIDISGRGRARRGCQMIAELYECPESIADMEIAFEQKAMQVISRTPARREAKERVAEVLHPLPVPAAEVDIASRRDVERNEFQRRPEVFRPVRAILVARNVIIAQKVIRRLRVPQHLCAEVSRGGRKRRQHHYDRSDARGARRP